MRVPTDYLFNQQILSVSNQYEKLANLQAQIANEKTLVASSDDPVLASRIKLTTDYVSNLDSYSQSATAAQDRTQLFSSSMQQAVALVTKIQDLIVSALDDTKNDTDRQTMATTLNGYLNTLLGIANTQDGTGDYIYAGFNVKTPPYALVNGTYQYQGGYDRTTINIGTNSGCVYSEVGYNVFGNIPLGNGIFTINAASTNTGTASTDNGSVNSLATYVPDTYTISFVTNASNQTGYVVTGAVSGQVIPPLPETTPAHAVTYTPGADISFNGINIGFSGVPNPGDTFTVTPGQKQDMFDTLKNLVTVLQTSIDGNPAARAQFHQLVSQAQASFTQISANLLEYESNVGTRLVMVNDQVSENTSLLFDQNEILRQLQDLDILQAIASLEERKLSLQVTQGSYNMIESLLMQVMQGQN